MLLSYVIRIASGHARLTGLLCTSADYDDR